MGYMPFSPALDSIYTLTSGNGQWRAVFNDPFDPNYAGMLTEVSGLDSPEIRESAEDLVEGDGGVHGNFYFGRRPITINGRIFGHATARERDQRLDYVRNATLAMKEDAVLSWVPRDRITNYVKNPRGQSGGTTGWSSFATAGSTAALADMTVAGYASGFRLTSTLNTVGHTTGLYQPTPYSYVSPRGGTIVPASINLIADADKYVTAHAAVTVISAPANSNAKIRLRVRALDSGGGYLGEPTVDSYTLTATSTGEIILGGVLPVSSLPANTAKVSIQVMVGEATLNGTIVSRIDKLALDIRRDANVPPFVDGASYNAYWWGEPGTSPSGDYVPQEIVLRRQQPVRIAGGWVKDFQLQMVAANPLILSPITRSTQINIGDWVTVENLGNAAYFPTVEVWGPLNYWSKIYGSGNELQIINPVYAASGYTTATQAGVLDMYKHTFKQPNGSPYEQHIDWATVADWPMVAPMGGTWTLFNGLTGSNTGGYIIVKSRDAWI